MNETENTHLSEHPDQGSSPVPETPNVWETWAKIAVATGVVVVAMWCVVFVRPGLFGVKVLAAIPYFGAATLIVLAWGLVRTLLNPPVLRRSRTIAFAVLLGTAFVATEPLIPAPLATETYQSPNSYKLPVQGEWLVMAGGRELDRNYHATFPPVRWGYDFTIVKDGKKYQLDGGSTQDWHCFGQPVFAPVAGTVVELQNRFVDNNPGEISPDSTLGNYVVIEAPGNEYVYLSHLKKGSITAKRGAAVQAGEQIAQCGNSGQSPEPHLHMHVQDQLGFPIAQGLPIGFSRLQVGGEPKSDYMPRGSTEWDRNDGDVVAP